MLPNDICDFLNFNMLNVVNDLEKKLVIIHFLLAPKIIVNFKHNLNEISATVEPAVDAAKKFLLARARLPRRLANLGVVTKKRKTEFPRNFCVYNSDNSLDY
ncbi:hypothetical protein BpHYR1_036331 [Brachionus plicatilis]|uniref:Uncharacterized protein n=1 Tax=Brachionus plicatilis TaxID=10195 RepID=A0A3M7QGK2_BRAPC|nr:hypothetical protein BpHYR1_036331 [Brachionus plicatilis]